jgi:hypothetical protein
MNKNRTTIAAIVGLAIGFILGVCVMASFGPNQQEVANLKEQVRVYEELVASYKAELAEINAVLAESAKEK